MGPNHFSSVTGVDEAGDLRATLKGHLVFETKASGSSRGVQHMPEKLPTLTSEGSNTFYLL